MGCNQSSHFNDEEAIVSKGDKASVNKLSIGKSPKPVKPIVREVGVEFQDNLKEVLPKAEVVEMLGDEGSAEVWHVVINEKSYALKVSPAGVRVDDVEKEATAMKDILGDNVLKCLSEATKIQEDLRLLDGRRPDGRRLAKGRVVLLTEYANGYDVGIDEWGKEVSPGQSSKPCHTLQDWMERVNKMTKLEYRYFSQPKNLWLLFSVTMQLFQGIELIQKSGYLHRNINPANIMLTTPEPALRGSTSVYPFVLKIGSFGEAAQLADVPKLTHNMGVGETAFWRGPDVGSDQDTLAGGVVGLRMWTGELACYSELENMKTETSNEKLAYIEEWEVCMLTQCLEMNKDQIARSSAIEVKLLGKDNRRRNTQNFVQARLKEIVDAVKNPILRK